MTTYIDVTSGTPDLTSFRYYGPTPNIGTFSFNPTNTNLIQYFAPTDYYGSVVVFYNFKDTDGNISNEGTITFFIKTFAPPGFGPHFTYSFQNTGDSHYVIATYDGVATTVIFDSVSTTPITAIATNNDDGIIYYCQGTNLNIYDYNTGMTGNITPLSAAIFGMEYVNGVIYTFDNTDVFYERLVLGIYNQSTTTQPLIDETVLTPNVGAGISPRIGGVLYDEDSANLIIYGYTDGTFNSLYFINPSNANIYNTQATPNNNIQCLTKGFYNIYYTNLTTVVAIINLNTGDSSVVTGIPNLANVPTSFSRFPTPSS
jgi:hypothetical protein